MGSFEWMELQTLTREIVAARSRLMAVRSGKNPRHTRALETEIAAAEERRTGLIASISTNLSGCPEPERREEGIESAVQAAVTNPAATQGGRMMWERLTPADLARAAGELDGRRAATLQRHAAELIGLEAERAELNELGEAIAAFVRRFIRPAPGSEIALLGAEREVRLQAAG